MPLTVRSMNTNLTAVLFLYSSAKWCLGTLSNGTIGSIRSTYHSIGSQYAQRYLSEFQYRFNRRFNLSDLIPRLAYVALRTPPMPEKLLKIGLG